MTGPSAFGLAWDEAEIETGWQGITALGFSAAPPPGVDAELVATLANAVDGLIAADVDLLAPDGGPLDGDVQPVADGDTEIRVHFTGLGPRGQSAVRLTSGGADPLHPFFAEAFFDFYIDCPAGDCRPAADDDTTPGGPDPAIDLATKDHSAFVRVAQDWAVATDPNWSDLTAASTEQMLIELLAHQADMLSLHQDRVAQEAFIDTARERLSLRRHAAFLGLMLDEGATAATTVAVDVGPGRSGYLPAGTRIIRREALGRITATFVTETAVLVDARWNAGLARIADRGALRPAAWPGAADAALPSGTRTLLLLDHDLGLLPGQRIALIKGTQTHVARLVRVDETEAPGWVADPGAAPTTMVRDVTLIEWDIATTARFSPWLDPVAQPFLITANLVDARHGVPREASNLFGTDVVPLGASRRDLVRATDPATGVVLIRALRTPEDAVLVDTGGRPALTLTIGGERWDWQPDLWTSAGFDRHYATEREEDGSVWLLFGDGIRGRAVTLPDGTDDRLLAVVPADEESVIQLAYRRGTPEDGNLGTFALNAAEPPAGSNTDPTGDFAALSVQSATNVASGTGGRRAVPMAIARQLIPDSIRHPPRERCVTDADYARAAEEVAGIAQAAAKPLSGLFNTIAVLCAPDEGDDLPADLADAVHAHIDRLRMAGREHLVRPPDYVALDIALLVCPKGEAGASAIRAAVKAALAPGSDTRPGFFHRSRIGFGAEVRLGDVLAAVAQASGVGAVKPLAFRPLIESGGADVRRAIRLGPTEIAQFAAEESRPERGRLTVRIEGVDPPEPPGSFLVGGPAPELGAVS